MKIKDIFSKVFRLSPRLKLEHIRSAKEFVTYERMKVVLFALFTVVLLVYMTTAIKEETLKEFIVNSGVWAPIVFMLAKVSTIIIAPLSGAFIYPLAGILFGTKTGLLYVAIADFIGYSTAFFISRTLGRKKVESFFEQSEAGTLHKIVSIVGTPKGFFTACFLFFPVPELLAYGGGLSRLPYKYFIAILMPLSILGSLVLVSLGEFIGFNKHLIFIMAGIFVFLLVVIGLWNKYWRK
ncbi:MAG: TVP38/TMEM64 family protein [Candidatus Pacebacteria bacterium]|nr:TVP38/TMEM64 family protein [Candidatus Paceibacterota bacterium]MBP9818674.1 TVP38/TMEM64 family protein [Candidatus Paceibacterota bacterium]